MVPSKEMCVFLCQSLSTMKHKMWVEASYAHHLYQNAAEQMPVQHDPNLVSSCQIIHPCTLSSPMLDWVLIETTLVHPVPVFLLPNMFLKFKFLMNKMSLKFIFLLYPQSNAYEQILRSPVRCMRSSNPSVRHCNANFFFPVGPLY